MSNTELENNIKTLMKQFEKELPESLSEFLRRPNQPQPSSVAVAAPIAAVPVNDQLAETAYTTLRQLGEAFLQLHNISQNQELLAPIQNVINAYSTFLRVYFSHETIDSQIINTLHTTQAAAIQALTTIQNNMTNGSNESFRHTIERRINHLASQASSGYIIDSGVRILARGAQGLFRTNQERSIPAIGNVLRTLNTLHEQINNLLQPPPVPRTPGS